MDFACQGPLQISGVVLLCRTTNGVELLDSLLVQSMASWIGMIWMNYPSPSKTNYDAYLGDCLQYRRRSMAIQWIQQRERRRLGVFPVTESSALRDGKQESFLDRFAFSVFKMLFIWSLLVGIIILQWNNYIMFRRHDEMSELYMKESILGKLVLFVFFHDSSNRGSYT